MYFWVVHLWQILMLLTFVLKIGHFKYIYIVINNKVPLYLRSSIPLSSRLVLHQNEPLRAATCTRMNYTRNNAGSKWLLGFKTKKCMHVSESKVFIKGPFFIYWFSDLCSSLWPNKGLISRAVCCSARSLESGTSERSKGPSFVISGVLIDRPETLLENLVIL